MRTLNRAPDKGPFRRMTSTLGVNLTPIRVALLRNSKNKFDANASHEFGDFAKIYVYPEKYTLHVMDKSIPLKMQLKTEATGWLPVIWR
jgi:hypothetical protein